VGVCMKDLKKIAAGAVIAGTVGFTTLGFGTGLANATPASPGIMWQQDGDGWWGHGHGHGHGHWDGDGGGWGGGPGWGWGGPGWGGPGWGWGGPVACGSVGWVSGCIG
jgi:hypothetical protein